MVLIVFYGAIATWPFAGGGPPTWRNVGPPPKSHVLVHVRELKHVTWAAAIRLDQSARHNIRELVRATQEWNERDGQNGNFKIYVTYDVDLSTFWGLGTDILHEPPCSHSEISSYI